MHTFSSDRCLGAKLLYERVCPSIPKVFFIMVALFQLPSCLSRCLRSLWWPRLKSFRVLFSCRGPEPWRTRGAAATLWAQTWAQERFPRADLAVQFQPSHAKHPPLTEPNLTMELILDGNSEMDADVRSNFCYLICLRHLIGLRAVTNQIFFTFHHACATCSELGSNIYIII